jgi:hypothetical protein
MGLPLLATASGHRRYPLEPPDSDSDSGSGGGSSGSGSGGEGESGSESGGGGGAARGKRRRRGGGGFLLGPDANALRLWRLRAEWVPCPAGAEAAGAGEEGALGDPPLVRV